MKQFDWNEKKMKQGEIGFIDDPEEEKQVWEAFDNISDRKIEKRKKELQLIARATLEKNSESLSWSMNETS